MQAPFADPSMEGHAAPAPESHPPAHVTFGPFVFDPAAMRLTRDGVEVKLRRQALYALKTLARHSGRCVSYDQMMAEGWHGVIVSRHTVDVTVGEVRRALKEYGGWIKHRTNEGYWLEVPKSEELVRRGWHFSNLRTRAGFERALECFRRAAGESPRDHRAYEGQSVCYLMLAAHGMLAGRDTFPKFLEAHQRAVALAGLTPELRSNFAHGLHLYAGKLDEAEAEFHEALRQRPKLASAHVRMAMLYVSCGRLDDALECLARAYEADPLWPTLAAIEVSIWFWRRDFDKAAALGANAVELHPYLPVAHAFHGQALEFSGRLEEALGAYRLGLVISKGLPWVRAQEGICLVKLGREKDARAVLEQLEALRRSDYVDAYGMGLLRHALGDTEGAFAELARAVEERCGRIYSLEVDPKADPLRRDPRFPDLLSRLFGARASCAGSADEGDNPPPRRSAQPVSRKRQSRAHA